MTFQRQQNRCRWSSCIFHYDARTTGYEEPTWDSAMPILTSDSFLRCFNLSRIKWTLIMIYRFNIKRNWINNFKFERHSQNYNFVFVVRICFYKEKKNDKLKDNVKIVIFFTVSVFFDWRKKQRQVVIANVTNLHNQWSGVSYSYVCIYTVI